VFGHLRVKNCRLSEKDRLIYRSHFCSVCHNLHAFGGWDVSLLTNYDVTLWSLVASGVSAVDYLRPAEWRPCTALPLRKVEVQPLSAEMGASLAAITILLAWAKVEDHRQDGGRLLGWLGQNWLGKREAKARDYLSARGYPMEALSQLPIRQAAAERDPAPTLGALCRPTQDALADGFEWIGVLAERPDLRQHLGRLGREIAAFVYLWDALQDLDKDRKSGAFNAVRAVWGESFPASAVRSELEGSLARMAEAIGRLPLGNRRKLCRDLVESLAEKVRLHPLLKAPVRAMPSPRRAIGQAGFLKTSDCDCGNSCCEVGCCDTGSGCGCCEVSCCDCHKGDACCELDCASCCGDGDCVICCCTDRGKGCSCCDSDCCGKDKKSSQSSYSDSLTTASEDSDEALLCPGCRHDLQPRGAAQTCRSCTGVWVDGAGDPDLRSLRLGTQPPAIPRGSRTCPRCRSLLRSPFGGEGPESCDGCGGRFYST
jgi:hypothetical protein